MDATIIDRVDRRLVEFVQDIDRVWLWVFLVYVEGFRQNFDASVLILYPVSILSPLLSYLPALY